MSRAGAVVDCPACGRSLRVPAHDGDAEQPEPVVRTAPDGGLLNALRQLADLDSVENQEPAMVPEYSETPGEPPATSAVSPSPLPVDSTETSSMAGLGRQRDVSGRWPVRFRALISLVVLIVGVAAFCIGYRTGQSGASRITTSEPSADERSGGNSGAQVDGERMKGAGQNAAGPLAEIGEKHRTEWMCRGRVSWVDGAGRVYPDAGALVLLLPIRNPSNFRLDARPLRDLDSTPSREAVSAALSVLGASFTRTNPDGEFMLRRFVADPCRLVVVSRHVRISEDRPLSSDLLNRLRLWFDSPEQLTGRLQAQEISVAGASEDEAAVTEVVFDGSGK